MANLSTELFINCMIIASLLFWGAWGICDKKALSYTAPIGQLAAVYCFSPLLVIIFVVVLTVHVPGWHLSSPMLFYEAMGSLAYFIATAAYLMAMSKGEASLILGATASYPVLAQLLAFWILKEDLVPARIIGCVVAILGIIVISRSNPPIVIKKIDPEAKEHVLDLETKEQTQNDDPNRKQSKTGDFLITIVGSCLASLGWAARGIFDKLACMVAHPIEVNLAKCMCDSFFAIVALIWVYTKRKEVPFRKRGLWLWASASALCLAGGGAAYFMALSKASASYVIAITGCYPVIMYFLALTFLKERFNTPRVIGIALITLGGIITQSTQSA